MRATGALACDRADRMARSTPDPIEKMRRQQARRVRAFTQHEINQIQTMAGIGLKLREIAACMFPETSGVTALNELETAMRADERVLFAIEQGLAQSKAIVAQTIFSKASAGDMNAAKLHLAFVHNVDDRVKEIKVEAAINTVEDLLLAACDDAVPTFHDAQAREV